jgi:hypothetical protein
VKGPAHPHPHATRARARVRELEPLERGGAAHPGRHEPRHTDAILDAELQAALDDPDPLRAIAQLTARWAAALRPRPDGVTRTKAPQGA